MDVASSAWHVISAGIVFLGGCLGAIVMGRWLGLRFKVSLALYAWHSVFAAVYLVFSLYDAADAAVYFEVSESYTAGFGFGTRFIYLFTSLFSKYLGFSYLGVFLVYNIFGSLGLLAFYSTVQDATKSKSRYWRLLGLFVVLLPSVSFWSSAIGKDSISFLATGLALWSGTNVRERAGAMCIAIAVMLLVRPHMAAILVLALAGALVVSRRLSIPKRIALFAVVVAIAIPIVPFALEYSGVGDASQVSDIAEFVEQRQGYNQSGGGGINIASMSFPMQVFTYLFRPLPYEASTAPMLAASLDNVALLLLAVGAIFKLVRIRSTKFLVENAFFLGYSAVACCVLALTTANLGISMRQKWMFVPMLIYMALSLLGRRRIESSARQPRSLR